MDFHWKSIHFGDPPWLWKPYVGAGRPRLALHAIVAEVLSEKRLHWARSRSWGSKQLGVSHGYHGHSRNRFIGGTYHPYIYIYIYSIYIYIYYIFNIYIIYIYSIYKVICIGYVRGYAPNFYGFIWYGTSTLGYDSHGYRHGYTLEDPPIECLRTKVDKSPHSAGLSQW